MSMTMDHKTEASVQPQARLRVATQSSWFLPIVNAVAWVGLVWIAMAVAPPVDPAVPVDTLTLVVSEAFWFAAIGAAIGLATRARWAYALGGVGGAALMFGAAACLVGGHTGAWIGVQALAGMGLAATGLASWRVSR